MFIGVAQERQVSFKATKHIVPPHAVHFAFSRQSVAVRHHAVLDIHKKTVVACVIVQGAKGTPQKTIRTFGTMTDDLLALGDWLAQQDVTHVAMESTGVYWQPIWNLPGRPLRVAAGQRPSHQAGPRPQD